LAGVVDTLPELTVVVVVSTVSAPVQISIPAIDRYSFLVVLSSTLSPRIEPWHLTVYHLPF